MRSVFLAIFFVAFSVGTMAQQLSIFKAEKSSTVYSNFSQDNNKAVVDSLHYDAANASSIGFDGPGNFGVYSYWPTESIAAYDGMVVSQLKVYIPQPDNLASAQLEIHHDQTSGAIYTQEFTPVVGWNAIDLTNPMPISSTQDFYIGYYMEATAGFPAGCDAGPVAANGNGNWIYDGTWAHLNDLASTLTGNWNIRAIVSETAGLDLSVKTLELGGITTETEHEIAGAVQNLGATEITSFDVSYSVAGGEETTLNIADVAIAAWGTYEFAFPELWVAEVGNYDITVSISNINGGEDENAANNSVTKNVVIASGSTAFMPLFEHFTASSCPPCATINSTVFTPQFIEDNTAVGTVIRYQVNWPGAGDPYYTEEVGTRVSYYGVGAVPSVFLNGSTVTLSTTASLQANLDAEAAKSAYFEMDATHAVDVAGQSISLNIDITPYVTDGGYTVHAVVIENETYDNASTNGETEFQHVTMKMVPGANGTQVDFVDGELESLEFTADLSGTNVEEYTDLSVVAFIQKNATKQISQSTYSVGAPIEFYTLNFTVTDGENPHEGATINIWDKELTTDASGLATVYIPEGTWNYTAQIEGYSTVEDSVVVDGADVSEDVVLARYALNYTVTANGEAVEGATITVAGSDLTTDVDGFATIEVVNGFYSYTIVKEGFPDYQEVVVVEGADIDIPVSLTGATMLTKAQLQVYPNPSNGVFKVTVDGVYTVQVLNNVGQVVYEETIDTNSSVDLSDLSSGMYVVSVKNDEKVATESIIIR